MMAGVPTTSAAAFVEGGVQDACDDACSICLENFCENDPSTITTCKHEYHLQCILEWSQRSKECPMCWQPLSLENPDSQTLLAASEQERLTNFQRSTYYQRSAPDESQAHGVRFGASHVDDSDLEDRIMQHLAAAAIGRAQHLARRGESLRYRPSPNQGLSHIMIEPARSNSSYVQLSSSTAVSFTGGASPASPISVPDIRGFDSNSEQAALRWSTSTYSHSIPERARGVISSDSSSMDSSAIRRAAVLEPPEHHKTTSDPSLSETLKSRLAAASSKYRDSLSKTTRGLRERLRLRNGAIAELGARAREVSAGVVRALEQISREPPERDSMSSPSSQAVRPGLSLGSDRSEQECSSSSLGERVNLSGVTFSSNPNSSHPDSVESSHCLDSAPVKGRSPEDDSRGNATRQTPTSPLTV
ncbi:unnamed protein product [Calypogeia fissa]